MLRSRSGATGPLKAPKFEPLYLYGLKCPCRTERRLNLLRCPLYVMGWPLDLLDENRAAVRRWYETALRDLKLMDIMMERGFYPESYFPFPTGGRESY